MGSFPALVVFHGFLYETLHHLSGPVLSTLTEGKASLVERKILSKEKKGPKDAGL